MTTPFKLRSSGPFKMMGSSPAKEVIPTSSTREDAPPVMGLKKTGKKLTKIIPVNDFNIKHQEEIEAPVEKKLSAQDAFNKTIQEGITTKQVKRKIQPLAQGMVKGAITAGIGLKKKNN